MIVTHLKTQHSIQYHSLCWLQRAIFRILGTQNYSLEAGKQAIKLIASKCVQFIKQTTQNIKTGAAVSQHEILNTFSLKEVSMALKSNISSKQS